MRTIQLTQGFSTVVDDEDFDRLNQFKWCAAVREHVVYAARWTPEGGVLMHREILGPDRALEVDHRDGDGLNNRRCNLRPSSRSQNQANSRKREGSASKFKGVSRYKSGWRARIGRDGGDFLGCFKSETDAALAYDQAARARWGDFARLNFPTVVKTPLKFYEPLV